MKGALAHLIDTAQAAASSARAIRPAVIEQKSVQDFVTDVDRRLQSDIVYALKKHFPGIPAFGEEDVAEQFHLPAKAFLIDPLDGTGNWIAGLPFSAVSIAYIENGETLMAAIAAIAGDTVYSAEAGKGAWRDELRLSPVSVSQLMALSSATLDAISSAVLFRALRQFGKLRNLGSQALQLCAVARGSLAFNASLEARLWDDAAGRLIAVEAGACYEAAVVERDRDRPAACQRSLCAHSAVFDAVHAILRPAFEIQGS